MRGVAARRKADLLIAAGRVTVNGVTPPPGGVMVIPGRDLVAVDGREVGAERRPHRYFVVNKPVGVVSAASDARGTRVVTELVGEEGLHPVGRLDKDSSGLVLLTDDGDLSFRLQHPRHHVEKEYELTVSGVPSEADLDRLRRGVPLEEGTTGPAQIRMIGPTAGGTRLRVVIRQGWKRQLRRMFWLIKHPVLELRRVRIASLDLGQLEEGTSRPLDAAEVAALFRHAGLGEPGERP